MQRLEKWPDREKQEEKFKGSGVVPGHVVMDALQRLDALTDAVNALIELAMGEPGPEEDHSLHLDVFGRPSEAAAEAQATLTLEQVGSLRASYRDLKVAAEAAGADPNVAD